MNFSAVHGSPCCQSLVQSTVPRQPDCSSSKLIGAWRLAVHGPSLASLCTGTGCAVLWGPPRPRTGPPASSSTSPLLLCLCSPRVLLGLGAPPPCPRPLPDHTFSHTGPAYLPRQVRYVSAGRTHDPPVQGSLSPPLPLPSPQRPLFPLEVLTTPCNSYGFLVRCLSAPLACKLPEGRGCMCLDCLTELSA